MSAFVDPGSLLFHRTAKVQIGIIGVTVIHNLFVDSLHGSNSFLIVGRTILSVYHLLGNIKVYTSHNVPVAISIVLDDILGESTFQEFHFLKGVYRLAIKSLFQVLIQYLQNLKLASLTTVTPF